MKQQYTGKKFNEDFKKMIVHLYYSGNSTVKELSSEYGVSEVTIYKWIKDFTPVTETDGEPTTPKQIADIQKRKPSP